MIISDLNYLEVTSEEIFGGRGVEQSSNITLSKSYTGVINEAITKTITTNYKIQPGSSTAELTVTADASGNTTFTSVEGGTQTEPGRSESFAEAISVSF